MSRSYDDWKCSEPDYEQADRDRPRRTPPSIHPCATCGGFPVFGCRYDGKITATCVRCADAPAYGVGGAEMDAARSWNEQTEDYYQRPRSRKGAA